MNILVFCLLFALSTKASTDSIPTSTKPFKVALFLPLHLDQLDQLDTVPDQSAQLLPSSIPAVHFYEAANMFRDSLAARGLVVEFHVLDTGQDTSSVRQQLDLFRGAGYDAILSMLPVSYLTYLTTASSRWKKPVYLFQSSNTAPLKKSPWLRMVLPSNQTQIRLTACHLAESFSKAEIHIVFRDQRNEREVAKLFKSVIDSVSLDSMRCRPFLYKGQSWTAFSDKLVTGKRNLIIVPSTDESFLSSLLNSLEPVRNEHELVLCGMPSWEGFESIDPVLLQRMKTIIFNGYFIDARMEEVKAFRRAFVNEFHADPLPQAFLAWDALVLAFQEWLGEDSTETPIINCLNIRNRLEPVCEGCGKENGEARLLRFRDFELQPFDKE